MKKLVVFTGAGVSAESGIATFRASDGLWENHRIEDVASPEGWAKNPSLVLEFYNMRRAQARKALPNLAHETIRELEQWFDVVVVTQNIDNLHERAGSSRIIHLHGSIFHARGTGKNEEASSSANRDQKAVLSNEVISKPSSSRELSVNRILCMDARVIGCCSLALFFNSSRMENQNSCSDMAGNSRFLRRG
jgi:NAD-dependent SIR2 family protein deacetylase